jgi:aspartate/glutamate racemase
VFEQLEDVDIVTPTADEIAEIHDTYFQMANTAAGSRAQFETLRHMAHKLMERGAEAIVFAGTDLSVVFNEGIRTWTAPGYTSRRSCGRGIRGGLTLL